MKLFRSHDDIAPPRIMPITESSRRPRFSVMIPAYEPDEKICHTIASVFRQAPAADDMQITVVDDASSSDHVERLVRSVDPFRRVEIVSHRIRLGLAGNWNRAIELARGHLVHLLHQDDSVSPGFYAAIDRGFRRGEGVGMAFCRSRIIDDQGRHTKTTSRQQWLSGVVKNWLPRIAERQRIQTPAAVVARTTYEVVGGYRSDLCYALDWEMWVRIAANFPVWYDPRPLATYRRHVANETSRLFASGAVWLDMARAIRINASTLPDRLRDAAVTASVRWHVASALRTAERHLAAGSLSDAGATLRSVPELLEALDGRPVEAFASRRLAAFRTRLRDGDTIRRVA